MLYRSKLENVIIDSKLYEVHVEKLFNKPNESFL